MVTVLYKVIDNCAVLCELSPYKYQPIRKLDLSRAVKIDYDASRVYWRASGHCWLELLTNMQFI